MISVSQSPRHEASSGCKWRNDLQCGGYPRINWTSSCGQTIRGGLPAWRLGEVLKTPHHKKLPCYWWCHDALAQLKKQKSDVRFSLWNVRNMCRSGWLTALARELLRYTLNLVGEQEDRWDKGGTLRAGNCTVFNGKGNKNDQLRTGFFVHHRVLSAVKKVEFISDRMSYIILRGRWCNIIALSSHVPTEENSVDSKDSFYEELEQIFLSSLTFWSRNYFFNFSTPCI